MLLGVLLLAGASQARPPKPRKAKARELALVKKLLPGRELATKKILHVVLKGAGACLFAPAMDYTVSPPLQLHLIQGGRILFTLSPTPADKAWPILRFEDVLFRDVNGDGYEDVLTLTRYMPVVGPRAGKAFNQTGLYLSDQGKSFELVDSKVLKAINEPAPARLSSVVKELAKMDKRKLAVPSQVSSSSRP